MNKSSFYDILSVGISYFDRPDEKLERMQSAKIILNSPYAFTIIYLLNGVKHNIKDAAYIVYVKFRCGFRRIKEIYYINGVSSRNRGPAINLYNYDDNGTNLIYKLNEYHTNGIRHSKNDLPAVIIYRLVNNKLLATHYEYYRYGKLHRVDGPAIIEISMVNGKQKVHEYYYDNGVIKKPYNVPHILSDIYNYTKNVIKLIYTNSKID